MAKLLDYESFWRIASNKAAKGNDLVFHPCCDVWTSRNSKVAQSSHHQAIKWRQVLHSLPNTELDQKSALHAKMVEERWQIPVIINQHCTSNKFKPWALDQNWRGELANEKPEDRLSPRTKPRSFVQSKAQAPENQQLYHLDQPQVQAEDQNNTQLAAFSFFAVAWDPKTESKTSQHSNGASWARDVKEALSLIHQICTTTSASVQKILEKLPTGNQSSDSGVTRFELQRVMEPLNSVPSTNSEILRLLGGLILTQMRFTSLLASSDPAEAPTNSTDRLANCRSDCPFLRRGAEQFRKSSKPIACSTCSCRIDC
jgi:hypothetical protein